ncbi:MAG: coiled-coil domain-containing protein 22 [Holosporales bacterium]|jgi:hypothetical protein|nr:coiled-coil domain-containing protein 22 [Holosporales bacterium]
MKTIRVLLCLVTLFEAGSCYAGHDGNNNYYWRSGINALKDSNEAHQKFENNKNEKTYKLAIQKKENAIAFCTLLVKKFAKEIEVAEKNELIKEAEEWMKNKSAANINSQGMIKLLKQKESNIKSLQKEIASIDEKLKELAKKLGFQNVVSIGTNADEEKITSKDILKMQGSIDLCKWALAKLKKEFAEQFENTTDSNESIVDRKLNPDNSTIVSNKKQYIESKLQLESEESSPDPQSEDE